MSTVFRRGVQVQQKITPIKGMVRGFNVDQETGDRQVEVQYTDATGVSTTRFFREDEIELVPEAPKPEEPQAAPKKK